MASRPAGFVVPLLFDGEDGAELPTADGRQLRIAEDSEVRGLLAMRNETGWAAEAGEDEEALADLPTDVLSAELRIADDRGRVWQATSTFGADLLLARMVDLSYANSDLSRGSRAKRKKKTPFDTPSALKEVLVSSDDRSYRYFTIDGKAVVSVQFEYTVMAFDVILHSEIEGSGLIKLKARLRVGCLTDLNTGEDLGGLNFSIDWKELFRCNTHKRAPDGRWVASLFPLPLVFRPLDESADAQEGVVVR